MTVYTKSHEEDSQWVWTSTVGSHQYSIKEDDGPDKMARGTRVVLHLKVGGVCEGVGLGRQRRGQGGQRGCRAWAEAGQGGVKAAMQAGASMHCLARHAGHAGRRQAWWDGGSLLC